jgi:8-oxo-dGTP pyrophosphatase MutT (NUDIX family)
MRSGLPLTLGAVGLLAAAAAVRRHGSAAGYDRAGHWGRAGAGVLLTTGKKVLVLLRSSEVTEPGTWALPGGAVDPGEDALVAGLRELREETGIQIDPDEARVVGSTVWQSPHSSFRYTTVVVRVPEAFTAKPLGLNWENDEGRWVTRAGLDQLSDELHPGLAAVREQLEAKAFGGGSRNTEPLVLYHGAQRWEGPPEIVAHRKGHAEHGPGIYLTTSYETAARYAKGGGSVYRMELRPGVRWLQDASLEKGPVVTWLKGLPRLRGKERLVAGVERVASRMGDTFPAEILVNQFVNEGASSGQHGPALAAFLVTNGVDASLTSPPMFGGTGGAHGEDWVVVFNPDILRSVTKVTAREVGKQAPFHLPRVRPKGDR